MNILITYLLGGLIFSFISEYTVSDEMLELNQASTMELQRTWLQNNYIDKENQI